MRGASIFTSGRGLQPLYYGKLLSYFNKYLLSLSKINPRSLQNLITLSSCLVSTRIMTGLISSTGFYTSHASFFHSKITQVQNVVSSLLKYVCFLYESLHYFLVDIYKLVENLSHSTILPLFPLKFQFPFSFLSVEFLPDSPCTHYSRQSTEPFPRH